MYGEPRHEQECQDNPEDDEELSMKVFVVFLKKIVLINYCLFL